MSKPPGLEELQSKAAEGYKYDFAEGSRILEAMDRLRKDAEMTRIPEIVAMIDAAYRILVNTYCSILRYEMTRLPGTEG
jgi:hypothetical protein